MGQGLGWQQSAWLLACLALADTGCSRKPTPQEVADQLRSGFARHFSTGGMVLHDIDCTEGSGDWDFLCQASYEPKPASGMYGIVPPRRLGVRVMGEYQGQPQFALSVLPDEGPVPTSEQLAALRKKEAAQAAAEAMRRLPKPH